MLVIIIGESGGNYRSIISNPQIQIQKALKNDYFHNLVGGKT